MPFKPKTIEEPECYLKKDNSEVGRFLVKQNTSVRNIYFIIFLFCYAGACVMSREADHVVVY